jgi:hypothetical protein
MAAPVMASASEKCVVLILVSLKVRFCSSGHVVPSSLKIAWSLVDQVVAVVVCTTAGLAVEIATMTWSSLVVTSARAAEGAQEAVGEFQRVGRGGLEIVLDQLAGRPAARGGGELRARPPRPDAGLGREGY